MPEFIKKSGQQEQRLGILGCRGFMGCHIHIHLSVFYKDITYQKFRTSQHYQDFAKDQYTEGRLFCFMNKMSDSSSKIGNDFRKKRISKIKVIKK